MNREGGPGVQFCKHTTTLLCQPPDRYRFSIKFKLFACLPAIEINGGLLFGAILKLLGGFLHIFIDWCFVFSMVCIINSSFIRRVNEPSRADDCDGKRKEDYEPSRGELSR